MSVAIYEVRWPFEAPEGAVKVIYNVTIAGRPGPEQSQYTSTSGDINPDTDVNVLSVGGVPAGAAVTVRMTPEDAYGNRGETAWKTESAPVPNDDLGPVVIGELAFERQG